MDLHHVAARRARLISILRRELRLSASFIQRNKESAFFVNGTPVFTNYEVQIGDTILVRMEEAPPDFPPEDAPIAILYEDDALLIVDKPAGLFMHPTASRITGTLANRVAAYYEKTAQPCGIHAVTRLDRDTFGVCVFAKNAHIHALLCAAQQTHTIQKTYIAAVYGTPPSSGGEIHLPIARRSGESLLREIRTDGQAAHTTYRVLASRGGCSRLLLYPHTGRTHQLRVHCAALSCPILGDKQYGNADSIALSARHGIETQQLCAAEISLKHPLTNEIIQIQSRQSVCFP